MRHLATPRAVNSEPPPVPGVPAGAAHSEEQPRYDNVGRYCEESQHPLTPMPRWERTPTCLCCFQPMRITREGEEDTYPAGWTCFCNHWEWRGPERSMDERLHRAEGSQQIDRIRFHRWTHMWCSACRQMKHWSGRGNDLDYVNDEEWVCYRCELKDLSETLRNHLRALGLVEARRRDSSRDVERLIAEVAMLQDTRQQELTAMRAAHEQELAAARLAAGRNPRLTAGVQSMTTYRRNRGRFQADNQGFHRGGETDMFPEDGWNDMMEEQLRLREYGV